MRVVTTGTSLLLISLLGTACTSGGFLGQSSDRRVAPEPLATAPASDATDLGVYLEAMRTIIEGPALLQADTLRRVEEAADLAPTTTNRLMYALILALPGHPGSDPGEAQRRLGALLAARDALLPAERLLAMIQLRDLEQRMILQVAATELRAELAETEQTNDSEAQRRIQSLIEENRQLQNALDAATTKLDAITSIEQSIRELENGSD